MKLIVNTILVLSFAVPVIVLNSPAEPAAAKPPAAGRSLFLKNCAHCHAKDGTGDDGPDLHGLNKTDQWIARRIRNGIKGKMTAFEKFSQKDVDALIAYLRTLK